jgi:uncharacterized membrane protein YeaQ/YmgE (transglycosylase-associated protein family)
MKQIVIAALVAGMFAGSAVPSQAGIFRNFVRDSVGVAKAAKQVLKCRLKGKKDSVIC